MTGRKQHGDADPSPHDEGELVAQVAPMLASPAVWIDPPAELGAEVIEALEHEIG